MVLSLLSLLFAPALAEEEGGESSNEIIVWGELAVERARQELIEDFGDAGYTERIERDGYVLLRSESAWKGEVRVYDDGWVDMKRQPVRLEAPDTPWAQKNSALAWASCVVYPFACLKTNGQLVSKRKLQAQKGRAFAETEPTIRGYGDRVADRETDRTINDLPDHLIALWEEGTPLAGTAPLDSYEQRREALLAFWDSRTDTIWGDTVREAVEAFILAEVQTSLHPYTQAEVSHFNTGRTATRELVLNRAGLE